MNARTAFTPSRCVVVVAAVAIAVAVVVAVVVCFQSDWFFIGFELLCQGHDRFKPLLASTKNYFLTNKITNNEEPIL